jgi:glycyl-tRNA synthetase (class II)
MAEPKSNELMEKIVSLCKRRGFIFQSSEIYGGINGFWDYGPMGAELKRNIKDAWWRSMTQERDDVVGLDASIIMHPKIWEASGHTSTFSDPMVDCLLTKKRFRADQVDPQSGTVFFYGGAIEVEEFERLQADYTIQIETLSPPDWINSFRELLKIVQYDVNNRILVPLVPIPNIGSPSDNRTAAANRIFTSLRELLAREVMNTLCSDSFSGLVEHGKPAEKAHKLARQHYQQRGLKNPILIFVDKEEVTDSVRYNPENGSLLTEPRPFNLMFKTFVGPVESEDNVAYLRPETAQAIFAQF